MAPPFLFLSTDPMRLFTIAAATCIALFPATASAQGFFTHQYVSLSGGLIGKADYTVVYPANAGRKEVELQAGSGAQLAFGSRSGNARFEGALGYRRHDAETTFFVAPGFTPPSADGEDVDVRSIDLNVFYDFPTGQPLRPYVGAGLGLAAVKIDDGTLDDEDSTLQLQAMAGASFAVTPRAELFVEGRVQRVGNITVDTFAGSATGDHEFDISNAAAFAGVRFGF